MYKLVLVQCALHALQGHMLSVAQSGERMCRGRFSLGEDYDFFEPLKLLLFAFFRLFVLVRLQ